MANPKKYSNIDEVELTHVQSGDMDNNIYYSYFSSNAEAKKKNLDILLKKNALVDIIDKIFVGDISDDQFRKITTALTFYDAIIELNKLHAAVTASDLYFATLVNWNASKGNGTNRIRSYSSLRDAHASAAASKNSDGLDYREFIINGNNEDSKFNNEYISILIAPKDYGSKFQVNLPIMPIRPVKLGLFRLCTERIAGYMTIVGDPENTKLVLPPHIWYELVEEGMSRRITTKFSKLEGKNLSKLVSTDHAIIDEIFAINDFRVAVNFMNIYQIDFDDDGTLKIMNTNEPPTEVDESNDFEWTELRSSVYFLKSTKCSHYVVSTHGNTVRVMTQ